MEKLSRRAFTSEFKIEAVNWVAENGLSCTAVDRLDEIPKLIKVWEGAYQTRKLMAPRDYESRSSRWNCRSCAKKSKNSRWCEIFFKRTAASRGVSFGHTLRGRASGASPEIR